MRFWLRFLFPLYIAAFIVMAVVLIVAGGVVFFFTGKPYEINMNYPSA